MDQRSRTSMASLTCTTHSVAFSESTLMVTRGMHAPNWCSAELSTEAEHLWISLWLKHSNSIFGWARYRILSWKNSTPQGTEELSPWTGYLLVTRERPLLDSTKRKGYKFICFQPLYSVIYFPFDSSSIQ